MNILSHRADIQNLFSDRFGAAIHLDEGTTLNEREHVAQFEVLEGPAESPTSVIAKGWRSGENTHYDPDSTDPWSSSSLIFNDWAGLQFLSEVMGDASPAPRFYAGDRHLGLIIIEDIGTGQDPADILLGNDPALAREHMLALAAALGRMHAATTGQKPRYDQIRYTLGGVPTSKDDGVSELVAMWLASLESLSIKLQPGATHELAEMQSALADPGPFLAFIHHDPCPDNWRMINGKMRLFDFETAGFHHALLDGVYGRIHFPTCWCVNRFPPDLPLAMEQTYRAELVQGCPPACDDQVFYSAVGAACAFWVLVTCEGRASLAETMEENREWGIATLRQRVGVRLGLFVETCASLDVLPALGHTASDLLAVLQARWSEDALSMPLYPAFR
jgi:hypothetical protein